MGRCGIVMIARSPFCEGFFDARRSDASTEYYVGGQRPAVYLCHRSEPLVGSILKGSRAGDLAVVGTSKVDGGPLPFCLVRN